MAGPQRGIRSRQEFDGARAQQAGTSVPTANRNRLTIRGESLIIAAIGDLCRLIWCAVVGFFRPRSAVVQAGALARRPRGCAAAAA
jgi:hypothetical protein